MINTNVRYAKRYYESALAAFEQGLYEKAIQQIELAIKKMPENPEFISTKGIFFHRMNDTENAAKAYRAAIQADSRHMFSHYNLGLIYMQENRPTDAINEWKEVLRVKPSDIDSIFNIAVALANIGKKRESIPFYKKVLALEPNHARSHQNLSVIYRDLKDYAKAKKHLIELKKLDSTYEEVVNREIAHCEEELFIRKLSEDNLKLQDEVSTVIDSELVGNLNGILSAIAAKDYNEALKAAEAYLKQAPNDCQAMLAKGQALMGLSKNDEAVSMFEAALAINETTDALFQLATALLNSGKYSKALKCFERLKEIDPKHSFVNENIAGLKLLLKEKAK